MDLLDAKNRINGMYRNAPSASEHVQQNIDVLEEQKEELELDAEAVDTAILIANTNKMFAWLQGKEMALQKGYTFGGVWTEDIYFNAGETTAVADELDWTNTTHWICLSPNQGFYPPDSPAWVEFSYYEVGYRIIVGGDFGTSTIRPWQIEQEQDVPNPPTFIPPTIKEWVVVYSQTVNWDNDPQGIEYMDDFDWGWDMLYKELDTGGTYGIVPNIDQLDDALSLLTENLDKIIESISVFSKYLPF